MKHTHRNGIPVVYIITKLELGGAQKVCLSLFKGVKSEQFTPYLISSNSGILTADVQNSENVMLLETLQWNVGYKFIVREFRAFWDLVQRLRTLRKNYPDLIVHTHSTKAGLLGRWAALFAGVKHRIHTIHGYALHPHQSWPVWLCIYSLEAVTSLITTHFVCVSSADAEFGCKVFPRFAKKYSMIRAAVDTEHFVPAHETTLQKNNGTFVFGTVACFKPPKNLPDMLRAFAYVHARNPNTRLEIIGDGVLRPQLEQLITELQLHDAVVLHGWQSDVKPFLANWDAFVLSSLWEGLPCAIVEARLMKLPIVTYNTGGIKDVIMHQKNGLLYPKKAWQQLANGMLEIANNKDLYTQLHAHQDDLSAFSLNIMIQQHQDLYARYLYK